MPVDETQFCLKIDFKRGEESPSRVFRAMTGLIEACQATDHTLARSITTRLNPVLLLDDVDTGSLVSVLRQTLEGVDDEALKSGEIKKIVGSYLVKSKYRILRWCDRRMGITDRRELEQLQGEIQQLAEETKVKNLPFYEPISMPKLVENMAYFEAALSVLKDEDHAFYISDDPTVELNKSFHIDANAAQALLTEKTLTNTIEAYLKIKKPDYLGQSMWEMVYDDRTIDVKILDGEWLAQFQARQKDVRPGDALFVDLRLTVLYGYDSSVIATHYEALRVKAIKPWVPAFQGKLFLREGDH